MFASVELFRQAESYKNCDVTFYSQQFLRESPPSGPLKMFVGKTLSKTEQDELFTIQSIKTYGGFTGLIVWAKIQSYDLKKQGWADLGAIVSTGVRPLNVQSLDCPKNNSSP